MAPPPRHVYSAVITNSTKGAVKLLVTYAMPQDAKQETAEFSADAGASVDVPQKTVAVDTCTHTGHICTVKATNASGKEAEVTAPFVASPTKNFPMTVVDKDDGIAINH